MIEFQGTMRQNIFLFLLTLSTSFGLQESSCFGETFQSAKNNVSISTPIVTKSYAFGLIYIYSTNFDLCNEKKTGEDFRKILESYFHACIAGTEYASENLSDAKNEVQQIDKATKETKNKILTQEIEDKQIISCQNFISSEFNKRIMELNAINNKEPIKWRVPDDCNAGYEWIEK